MRRIAPERQPADRLEDWPERPRLHPWIPLLRAGGDRVLIGAHAPTPLPARDSAAVRAAAAAADGRATREQLAADPLVARGLHILQHHGALVTTEDMPAAASSWTRAQRDLFDRARLSRALTDPHACATVARRGTVPVRVFGPPGLTDQAAQAMLACGLDAATSGPRTVPGPDVVAVAVGRMTWAQVHEWTSAGVPHLAISPRAASVRVGPMVVPGESACLQCLHLARRDRRPHWQPVSAQLPRTVAPYPDPMLLAQAWAVATRCLVGHLQDSAGPARNAYWEIALADVAPRRVEVARHPLCGCWWPPAPETPDWDPGGTGSPTHAGPQ